MKKEKKLKKILSAAISAAFIVTMFSSCAGKNGETGSAENKGSSSSDSSGFVPSGAEKTVKMLYKNEKVPLDDMEDGVMGMTVSDGKVYAVSSKYNYDEETKTDSTSYYFVVFDLDGKLISKTDITPKTEKKNEGAYYSNMTVSKDGNLWAFEKHYFYDPSMMAEAAEYESFAVTTETASEEEEAPEETEALAENGDTSDAAVAADESGEETAEDSGGMVAEDVPVDYSAPEQTCVMKKIASDGSIIFELDSADTEWMSKFFGMEASAYINYICSDTDGNIYLFGESYQGDGSSVTVVDKDGKLLFDTKLSADENVYSSVNGACTGHDGKVYVMKYEYDRNENTSKNKLYYCDMTEKCLKQVEDFNTSFNGYSLTDGSGDYLFFSYENNAICGYKADGTCDELYNAINNGLDVNYVEKFYPNGDGFLVLTEDWDYRTGKVNRELIKIMKRDESEIKEKIEVTLSAYYLDNSIRSAVAAYNDSDGDYVITVTDYSKYNDYSTGNEEDYQAGYTRLKADIAAGNIADILCSPYDRSFAAKGLYLDLNTLIDSDSEFDRADYSDRILRSCEINGKLYYMPLGYSLQGYAELKKYVPNDGKLSSESLESILSENSEMELFAETDRNGYIEQVLNSGSGSFIDFGKNECRFNSPEFIKVLETSSNYPETINYDEDYDYAAMEAKYVTGKALAMSVYVYNYTSLRYTEAQFGGGEISVTGFPGLGTNPVIDISNTIMIYSKAAHPEAGWQLIKSALSEENQDKGYSFPINNKSREKLAESNIDSQYYTDKDGNKVANEFTYYINNQEVKVAIIDEKTVEWINSLIDLGEVSTGVVGDEFIMNIIKEEAEAYWAGTNPAETAAANIQSRVSLYLSEQS